MLAALAACRGADPASYSARDPCAALAVAVVMPTSLERDAIGDALALWRDHGVAAFDAALDGTAGAPPVPAAPTIAIEFDAAAAAFHGVYDPAADRVLINRAIDDRATLAIVIAHELGHVFGLVHIAPAARISLMNPGNLVTPPTDADQRALDALWGACR